MGLDDCIERVIKASDSELDTKSVTDIWEKIQKEKELGKTNAELRELFEKLETAEAESLKALRRFNLMKDFSLRKQAIERVLETTEETAPKGFIGKVAEKLGYNEPKARMKRALLDYYRMGEQWTQNLNESTRNQMHLDLSNQELTDFVYSGRNDANIIREIGNLSNTKVKEKVSVTGDTKAFDSAKVLQKHLQDLHSRKKIAGSTVKWKDGFITSNMWDDSKFIQYTDDEFYELVKGLDWGDKGSREDWITFKNQVQNRSFVDVEDTLLQGDIEQSAFGDLTRGSSLAESSGAGRQINLTTEQYLEIAPKLFKGDTLAERLGFQINNDSRVAGQLEWFGSNPEKQAKGITDQLMAKTLDDKRFTDKQGKHFLNNGFWGAGNNDSRLSKQFFGYLNNPENGEYAAIWQMMRGYEALAKLPLSAITAQADAVIRAARKNQLLNGESSIFVDTARAFRDSVKQFGKDSVEIEGRASVVGLQDMLDVMHHKMRHMGEAEGLYNGRGVVKKTNELIQTAFKFNGLEGLTNMNLRAAYKSTQNLFHSLRGKPIDSLSDEIKLLFRGAGLTENEWKFISKHGEFKDVRGNGLLAIEALNETSLDEYSKLYPGLSKALLEDKKMLLSSRWNTVLRKEARTSTIMPDIVDTARLNMGTRKGTFLGEVVRSTALFRSFAFGVTARVLTPMALSTKLITQAEYLGAMTLITMLIKTEQALVSGKTPPDFADPKVAMGIAGMVMGVPFIDQLGFVLTSDNPQQSTIPDLLAGALITDMSETGFRAVKVIQDLAQGDDPEIAKQLLRTFGPASPTRVAPGVSIIHDKVYNNLMDHYNPGNRRRRQKAMRDRGQEYLFGN